MKNEGHIYYIIRGSVIEPVEFIKEHPITNICAIKNLNTNEEQYVSTYILYKTKEEACKALISDLEYEIADIQYSIDELEDELHTKERILENLKQEYEI